MVHATSTTTGQHGHAADVILASTSRWRRSLLERLGVAFQAVPPGTDESPLPGETPGRQVARLAREKALAVAARHPDALVIGSDQLACRGAEVLGKPGDDAAAVDQLRVSSGREVAFLTAITLVLPANGAPLDHLDVTRVLFRHLSLDEIRRYVAREQPLDCAGSFRCEGLGISLFRRIESRDPTALIGLPLIWLAEQLRRAGIAVP